MLLKNHSDIYVTSAQRQLSNFIMIITIKRAFVTFTRIQQIPVDG